MELKDTKENMIIADRAVAYLKNRMMLNQQIIKMKFSEEELISFDDFMKRHLFLESKIAEIKDHTSSERKNLVKAKKELTRVYADTIVLTEEQIEELMSLIRKSIETYGLRAYRLNSGENFFILEVLNELMSGIRDELGEDALKSIDYQKSEIWRSYIQLSDNVGFCRRLLGQIVRDTSSNFAIITHERKILCNVDINGDLKVDHSLDEEDILLLPNLYVGNLHINGKEVFTIFLEKFIDGRRLMKAIKYDQQLYPTIENRSDGDCYVDELESLHSLLSTKGLNCLEKVLYNKDTIYRMIEAYNNGTSLTDKAIYNKDYPFSRRRVLTDEEKGQIDILTEIAANWWVEAVVFPSLTVSSLKRFKELVANEIKTHLLYRPYYTIIDNSSLLDAIEDARLKSALYDADMYISLSNIIIEIPNGKTSVLDVDSIVKVDNPKIIEIYNANKLEESIGDGTPSGPKF